MQMKPPRLAARARGLLAAAGLTLAGLGSAALVVAASADGQARLASTALTTTSTSDTSSTTTTSSSSSSSSSSSQTSSSSSSSSTSSAGNHGALVEQTVEACKQQADQAGVHGIGPCVAPVASDGRSNNPHSDGGGSSHTGGSPRGR